MILAAVWAVGALGVVIADQVTIGHLVGGVAAMVHLLREGSR